MAARLTAAVLNVVVSMIVANFLITKFCFR
jgi:hypothetical protein